jgi:hypothetical protein
MSDVDESTPLIKTKKEKKEVTTAPLPQPTTSVTPTSTVNKKQRTIKQLEAFERARVKRLENLNRQKDEKLQELGNQYLESQKQKLRESAPVPQSNKQKLRKPAPVPDIDSELEYEELISSEEEIIIKRKPKPKAKPKTKIVYVTDSSSESDYEPPVVVDRGKQKPSQLNPNDFFV